MSIPRSCVFAAVACAWPALVCRAEDPARPAPAATDPAVASAFVANCAQCHGERGDGQGTTKLDKPARSFRDGGFAYGNTPETILRTITNGIPGTPMPSFSGAIPESMRKELAKYVIALGPEQIEVKSSDTILVVHDKPLVVRGKLPPIVEGAPERPRGLLIGTPDGLTFEYRIDDVRLLGVRQGAFVDRKDWGGRGGDALQPLGKVVVAFETTSAGPAFSRSGARGDVELRARLVASQVRDARAGITYEVIDPSRGDRPALLRVEESPSACTGPLGPGFARRLGIEALADVENLVFDFDLRAAGQNVQRTAGDLAVTCAYRALGPGEYDLIAIQGCPAPGVAMRGAHALAFWLKAGERRTIEIRHVPRAAAGAGRPPLSEVAGRLRGFEAAFE